MTNLYRALSPLLLAPALLVPGAGAFAQPPEQTVPAQICLTNACSEALQDPARPTTVSAAVKAGDALVTRALGGTPDDVLSALLKRVELDAGSRPFTDAASRERWLERERAEYRHYRDASLGAFNFATPADIGMPPGMGLPTPGGGANPAAFIVQRRTPSGCMEFVVVHENGAGVPSARLCNG